MFPPDSTGSRHETAEQMHLQLLQEFSLRTSTSVVVAAGAAAKPGLTYLMYQLINISINRTAHVTRART
jgi:hypothetical protein